MSRAKAKADQEEDSSSIPLFLGVKQLLRLGKDCGFDDKDDRELLDVMSFATNGV
jgi:hypothetical protein